MALHWRKCPPTHIAARRLEQLARLSMGIGGDQSEASAAQPVAERHNLDDLRMMASQMNAGARHG